jgi:hypothetical protein
LALVALALLPAAALAQPNSGVKGTVLDTTCSTTGCGATVLVRRTGSAQMLMRLPVNEGHFHARLAPGRYVLLAHVGLPCWTGTRQTVTVEAGRFATAVLQVNDGCVVHPDGASASP